MKCPSTSRSGEAELIDFAAGRCNGSDSAALRGHIAVCPLCKETVSAQQLVWEALSGWEPDAASWDFDRRLYARIDQELNQNAVRRWLRFVFDRPVWIPRSAIPVFAAVLLAVGLVATDPFSQRGASEPDRKAEAEVAPLDAEQLSKALDDLQLLDQLDLKGASRHRTASRGL